MTMFVARFKLLESHHQPMALPIAVGVFVHKGMARTLLVKQIIQVASFLPAMAQKQMAWQKLVHQFLLPIGVQMQKDLLTIFLA